MPDSIDALPLAALPQVAPGTGFQLLQGIRVLDLMTSVSGPSATMLLADLGAEVIKVERPGLGDDCRAWGPPFLDGESLWFQSVNRNKQGITLEYATDDGRAVLADLIRAADVFVVNQPPRVQRKLGTDYETVRGIRDDIVFVSITGYGLSGERADRPGYDLIAEGYSGVMDLTGEADGPPQKVGAPAADLLAGQDAALFCVAALVDRMKTGNGHLIDVSLVESMSRFMASRVVAYLGSGDVPKRSGAKDSVIAVYQVFETKDEPMTLGLGNDNIFRRFWAAVGQPGYADRPETQSNAERTRHRAEIVADVQAVLMIRTRAEWLELFAEKKIPSGPINRIDQLVADAALTERGLFYCLADDGRRIPQVGPGVQVDGVHSIARAAPPRLGQHTATVLSDLLGYEPERLAALKAAQTI